MSVHWGDGGRFLRLSRCNEEEQCKIAALLNSAKAARQQVVINQSAKRRKETHVNPDFFQKNYPEV
jgi:hypothetical protein